MIITREETDQEIVGVDAEDVIEAGIDANNYGFLFSLLSEKFYSDTFGSVVREIASNAHDANVESGSEEPIIIRLDYDQERDQPRLVFIDNGIGMSPDKIRNIYVNWTSSDKRKTNKFIGGFGLGSKSPFSYRDYFYVTTIVEGIRYEYVFTNENPKPKLTPLGQFATTEKSGTKISIDVENLEELELFRKAIAKQLPYFDKVFVYDYAGKYDNEYGIIEGNTFKLQTKYYKKGANGVMHVLLGKVVYPIRWDKIGMDEVKIPVGVKFEIGDLRVTPNREELVYDAEGIAKIKFNVNDALDELAELYNKQMEPVEGVFNYIERSGETRGLKLGDITLTVPPSFKGRTLMKGFEDMLVPTHIFDHRVLNIVDGKEVDYYNNVTSARLQNAFFTERTDKYNNIYIHSGNIILPQRTNLNQYFDQFRLGGFGFRRYKAHPDNDLHEGVKAVPKIYVSRVLLLKKHLTKIYKYREMVRDEILARTKRYQQVDARWIQLYELQNKVERKKKAYEIITVWNGGRRADLSIETLVKKQVVFYGIKDISTDDSYNKRRYFTEKLNEQFAIIIVSQSVLNKLEKEEIKLEPISNFYKYPMFQRTFARITVKKQLLYLQSNWIRSYSDYYDNMLTNLLKKYENVPDLEMRVALGSNIVMRDEIYLGELRQYVKNIDIMSHCRSMPDKYKLQVLKTIHNQTKLKHFYESHQS